MSGSSRSSSSSGTSPDDSSTSDWRHVTINGGSLRHVDLHTGSNGWATPPSHLFSLRSQHFFSRRQKLPAGDPLLLPAGVDWLKSPSKLSHLLSRPDNRISAAISRSKSKSKSKSKPFVFAVNLQIPGRECHSAVFYFTGDSIETGSLFDRFVNGNDAFRNQRFKIVNRIVKGPWIVKAAVGNYAACLLGKALKCEYHRGENYLEIDVDIGSSAIANAILHLALGYVTAVTIDMGFVVEAQEEGDLPEKLIGAVRITQMEMGSATFVETRSEEEVVAAETRGGGRGTAKIVDRRRSWWNGRSGDE